MGRLARSLVAVLTVISVVPDQQAHTLTLTAQYAAPVEDVWQLWADPRQLERWWGPPTYPVATVLDHDLSVGGRVRYVMTGPAGDQHAGWWRLAAVAAPTGLEFDDGFGDPDAPSPSLPVSRTRVTISDVGGGVTRMVLATSFPSAEAMDQLLAMGMREGLTAAVDQTDDLLAGAPRRQRRRRSSCANSAGPVPAATTTTGPRVRRPGPPRYRGWRRRWISA